MHTASTRPPWHLWLVGGLATLWGAFGAYDYLMSRTHDAAYIESMMPGADSTAMFAYMDAMPLYAAFGWGLGIWAGLTGAILLLVRSRLAVPVYAASLVGIALSFFYQLAVNPPPPGMDGGVMTLVVIAVALGQFWYAWRQRARGVLR